MARTDQEYLAILKGIDPDKAGREYRKKLQAAQQKQQALDNRQAQAMNQGSTQSSAPLLPIRQQAALPGPTNNQLSNACLLYTSRCV